MGDAACLSCHNDKATFEQTAHRRTASLPTHASILGSFRQGENRLRTRTPGVYFSMDDTVGFTETRVDARTTHPSEHTERIAYVVGSGRRGQSFLYWSGDALFQMPVSWWSSLHTWSSSPGPRQVDRPMDFDRGISARCLECHTTYFEWKPDLSRDNRFEHGNEILGITCERCHGAGKEHVAREQSLLHRVRLPAIVNPARLSRERQMDMCAQCHGGLGEPQTPSFTYVAGRQLAPYLRLPRDAQPAVDIHASQVTLLERSACFRNSQMTCLTCHDVHQEQRDVRAMSGRCLTCHTQQSCPLFAQQGQAIVGRCVDCHMPRQKSNLIVADHEGQVMHVEGRTHWIRVY